MGTFSAISWAIPNFQKSAFGDPPAAEVEKYQFSWKYPNLVGNNIRQFKIPNPRMSSWKQPNAVEIDILR